MANPLYLFAERVYRVFERKPVVEKAIFYGILVLMIALGLYIRALPAVKYGLELHANDPWIEYWQANYTYYHGPLSWYTLTRENPDTHIFWYPWGRDFTTSSYPGLPIWTALTYNIVKYSGLTLKDWVALQPIVFAFLSYLTLYLAVREISRNNKYAIVSAFILYAIVPAASDRSIIGFVEKAGIALTFIYLTIYFYSKLARMINDRNIPSDLKLLTSLLTGICIAVVGWFWGGYIYVLATMVAFIVLYPLFNPKAITSEFIKYHLILVLSALFFVIPAPSNLRSLGFLPFKLKSPGIALIAALILPIIFYLLHSGYKKIGLKKPLLNPSRYFGLLLVIIIIGIVLYANGLITMSPRFAWALGLRAISPAPPLVQSIEEHQSPLSSPGMFSDMLRSWGTGLMPLLLFSPLAMAIFGALYLIYRGGMDQVYVAIAFLIGFYSYLNASYMEATAASTGLLVAGVFIGYIVSKIIPSKREVIEWRKARVRIGTSMTSRIIALLFTILIGVNLVFAGIANYQSHSNMIYSIMAGGAPLAARTNAWYETIDFLRHNLSKNAVVIAWWDYGYWISVAGDRISVADGATLNSTQIKILARILTATDLNELFENMKLLRLPPNDTYILVFDVFWFFPSTTNPSEYTVMPYYSPYSIVGMVDIPKSIWMIRIGGRDIANYFYLYNIGGTTAYIAPRLDQPDQLPLIYKIMVDGILALSEFEENKTFKFAWYTGTEGSLSYRYQVIERVFGINREITVTRGFTGQPNMRILNPEDRPFANSTYIKPYMIIAEPFEGIVTGQGATLVEVVFIYKVVIPQQ